ncbi:hypothetical protein I4U23_008226 [Adineta vaga]|nr:hypothetical protein I4U23_008226 [Adineta vaga]
MAYYISLVFLFSFISPSLIHCQSGTFLPATGRLDSVTYKKMDWMITELGCVSTCLQQRWPLCYAISYESFRQECRLITQVVPSTLYLNQSFHNWRTYVRVDDS